MNRGGRFVLIAILCASLPACKKEVWSPVPEQQPSFDGFPTRSGRVVDMADPDADVRIVRDIMPKTETPWRWTGKRPAVRIKIHGDQKLNYTIDFTLPDISFKDTGPVEITFTVNDRVLDKVRYSEPGNKKFEAPVPAEWIPAESEAIVGAEVDKMWASNDDDKRLGFILSRLGLKQ